jgi:hypothetical protein
MNGITKKEEGQYDNYFAAGAAERGQAHCRRGVKGHDG